MPDHELFKSEFVKAAAGSDQLFEEQWVANTGPVTCLGKEFTNDAARREYFTGLLREKLKNPDFRKIEGFPLGKDEDILALSDPPYYCACPNPWLSEFIQEWEEDKPVRPAGWKYSREPFAADVSEGKNDPIYNAHSYHTKVPHKAIMRYILHYTEPGDIVFDGFCGTGMTGVAAQMCADISAVRSLGYAVDEKTGNIFDPNSENPKQPVSRLGARKAILNDLSPAATFIAYNYNTPVDVKQFELEAKRILAEVEKECGWMYETLHSDGKTKGKINYTVWSDVFVCPECTKEIVFWDAAVDKEAGKVQDSFTCPHCSASLTKRNMTRAFISKFDNSLQKILKQAKQLPVLISYTANKHRFEKKPDQFDLDLIQKIEEAEIPYWFPTAELPDGFNTRQPMVSHGLSHVHHFYTSQSLPELARIWERTSFENSRTFSLLKLSHTAASPYASKMRRFRPDGKGGGPLAGTLYIPSIATPPNPILTVSRNVDFIVKGLTSKNNSHEFASISTQSLTSISPIPDDSQDYLFIDPPFGSNINYSELNFIWESWLKVTTNNKLEAIENEVQQKGAVEYRKLMTDCFREAYRILKPGRWMTVEFSNTSAAVWNSIQKALSDAGFIVANVAALDKQQGSFKAVTTPTAVKQDLIISAYKPNDGFEERFIQEAGTETGVWDFVRTHLKYLSVAKVRDGKLVTVSERDPRLLFDQLVAYYFRKGLNVPISSQDFQEGLARRFDERDGMYFLPEQSPEYDRRKATAGAPEQGELFVSDEVSAIAWLRQLLKVRTLTFQEINPLFMQETSNWKKYESVLELQELLEQNFLCYNGITDVPSQIHTYLSSNWHEYRELPKNDPKLQAKAANRWFVPDPNKAGDLEKLREKNLLREFEDYRKETKKLKTFRLEAVRAGFKKAYQERDYQTIISVGNKIPDAVIEEDPKLLMWFEQAQMLAGK